MMESYCFDALEKGYVSNEMIVPSDSIIRSKNVLMGWEFKPPFSSYDNNNNNTMLVSNQQSLENPDFPELGIVEIIRKQFPHDIDKNVFSNDGCMGDIITPSLVPSLVISNGASGDEDSSSKISSSVVDSSSRESSLIDLKLGGLGDNNMKSSSCGKVPNSAESTTPVKRVRTASLSSQTVYCQVYGCHKDLSSSKDYHKRHKVCDIHTKTSKVVVNGIEQRFCQQCSRFHLLGEFDDGKRSCRKRLAGHNERRRKPQVAYNSGRAGRSFSFRGSVDSKYQGTLAAASFICQDMFLRGPCHVDKYRINDWSRHVKIENGIDSSQNSANNFINRQLQGSSVSSPSVLGKQYPSNDNNGRQTVLEENVPQYPHETVSRSMVQMNSFGSEDLTLFDAASTVQGLSGVSESGCALSLLSSQSLNSPAQSSRMPGAHTLTITSSNPNYSVNEVSEKGFGVGSDLTREIQSRYPAYGISPFVRDSDTGLPMPSDGDTANSGFGKKNIRDSEFVISKNDLPYEGGTTIDLLQLSSQLHRVENQRQSAPGKQESEGFCGLRMT